MLCPVVSDCYALHCRQLTANMNERFPDATEAELEQCDHTCIICRYKRYTMMQLIHLIHHTGKICTVQAIDLRSQDRQDAYQTHRYGLAPTMYVYSLQVCRSIHECGYCFVAMVCNGALE